MDNQDTQDVKEAVRKMYSVIAAQSDSGCGCGCTDSCCSHETMEHHLGYADDEIASIPEESMAGLGCGNPTAIAALREGEVVVDLGSGMGIDAFLAAKKVGAKGRVIGVDMTTEMVAKAQQIALSENFTNVEFRQGEMEDLPVEAGTVDVIISNCAINLCPDKLKAFREAWRILKPGGRLAISDTVSKEPLPAWVREDLNAWAACVGGAMQKEEYVDCIKKAGFTSVTIASEKEFNVETSDGNTAFTITGVTLNAVKPA